MQRRPDTRPTSIYWLIDNRPSTRAEGWRNGRPFYCGKTVHTAAERMAQHRYDAVRFPARMLGRRVREIGKNYLRVVTMEVVPASADWGVREHHWIAMLRAGFPDTLNLTTGGQGAPGAVRSLELRARIRAGNVGKKRGKRTRARMVKALHHRLYGGRRRRARQRQARAAIRQCLAARRLLILRVQCVKTSC